MPIIPLACYLADLRLKVTAWFWFVYLNIQRAVTKLTSDITILFPDSCLSHIFGFRFFVSKHVNLFLRVCFRFYSAVGIGLVWFSGQEKEKTEKECVTYERGMHVLPVGEGIAGPK